MPKVHMGHTINFILPELPSGNVLQPEPVRKIHEVFIRDTDYVIFFEPDNENGYYKGSIFNTDTTEIMLIHSQFTLGTILLNAGHKYVVVNQKDHNHKIRQALKQTK